MNRQGNPVRRYISAALTLLTFGLSVAVPVMERGSLVGRMAIESEHDPARCAHQHDHRVCTQVGANLSLNSAESAYRPPHVLVHSAPASLIRTWTGSATHEGPPPRAPPLA